MLATASLNSGVITAKKVSFERRFFTPSGHTLTKHSIAAVAWGNY
jgi:hypothetical protein